MKKLTLSLYALFLVAALIGCKNSPEEGSTAAKEDATVVAAKFKEFLGKFSPLETELPKTFGEEWIAERTGKTRMDSTDLKRFIYGNKVINHQFGDGQKEKEIVLDNKQEYYYVCTVPLDSVYQSVIVSNLSKDQANTYMLTYTNEGKFISGITLQNLYLTKQPDGSIQKTTRESLVSDSKVIISRETVEGVGVTNIMYDIQPDGRITGK